MAQSNSLVHDITSIAQCKYQQNVLTTEITKGSAIAKEPRDALR